MPETMRIEMLLKAISRDVTSESEYARVSDPDGVVASTPADLSST